MPEPIRETSVAKSAIIEASQLHGLPSLYGTDESPNLNGWQTSITGSEHPDEHIFGVLDRHQVIFRYVIDAPSEADVHAAAVPWRNWGTDTTQNYAILYIDASGNIRMKQIGMLAFGSEIFEDSWRTIACPGGSANRILHVDAGNYNEVSGTISILYEGGSHSESSDVYLLTYRLQDNLDPAYGVSISDAIIHHDLALDGADNRDIAYPIYSSSQVFINTDPKPIAYRKDSGDWVVKEIFNDSETVLPGAVMSFQDTRFISYLRTQIAVQEPDGTVSIHRFTPPSGLSQVGSYGVVSGQLDHSFRNSITNNEWVDFGLFGSDLVAFYQSEYTDPNSFQYEVIPRPGVSSKPYRISIGAADSTSSQFNSFLIVHHDGKALGVWNDRFNGYNATGRLTHIGYTEPFVLLDNPDAINMDAQNTEEPMACRVVKYGSEWNLEVHGVGRHRPVVKPSVGLGKYWGGLSMWTADSDFRYLGDTTEAYTTYGFGSIPADKLYKGTIWEFSNTYFTVSALRDGLFYTEGPRAASGDGRRSLDVLFGRWAVGGEGSWEYPNPDWWTHGAADSVSSTVTVSDGIIVAFEGPASWSYDGSWSDDESSYFAKLALESGEPVIAEVYNVKPGYDQWLDDYPQSLSLHPDGTFYAMIGYSSGVVAQFDSSFNVIREITLPSSSPTVGDYWQGMAVHPETGDLYLYDEYQLVSYDVDGNQLRQWQWVDINGSWATYAWSSGGVNDEMWWEANDTADHMAKPVFQGPYIFIPAYNIYDATFNGGGAGVIRVNIEDPGWTMSPGDFLMARGQPEARDAGSAGGLTLIDPQIPEFVASNEVIRLPTVFGRPN